MKLSEHWSKECVSHFVPLVYGQTVTQLECTQCKARNHIPEAFSALELSFSDMDENPTLHHMLDLYLQNSVINDWTCDACNKKTDALKSHKFWRLPSTLFIIFKRTDYLTQRRINKTVSLPPELNMDRICIYDDHCNYALHGVACHVGGAFSGHYFALCYNADQKEWNVIDDDSVRRIGSYRDVSSRDYYMAMYVKVKRDHY
jgi:ubiquitin C-terminal hydrolase